MVSTLADRKARSVVVWGLCFGLVTAATSATGEQTPQTVGIEEKLSAMVPIDELVFRDEQGKPVVLGSLFDIPVVLTLVYFRCPGICTPLLQDLASVVQKSDLVAGEDYRLITISFDPQEGADLARMKQHNMISSMTRKPIAKDAWRFFTGDEATIRRLAKTVGFNYVRDKNGQDYVHGATLTFLGSNGMVARYLQGTRFNPADFELAVVDASMGRARSFMKRIQRLCYAFKPESHTYTLQINRIILGVTLVFVALFIVFVVIAKPGKRRKDLVEGAHRVEEKSR